MSTPRFAPRSRRIRNSGLGVMSAALSLSIVASTYGLTPAREARAASVGGTLNVAYLAPPTSLDPAKNAEATNWFDYPAYDPLIRQESNGKLVPDLATSWKYIDKGNKVFQLTLRKGVKFSDGTALTAAGVAKWIEYFVSAKGPQAIDLNGFKSAVAAGPLTVRITLANANPLLPTFFNQQWLSGDVVSPKALQNPGELGTNTFGAGPYMLSPGATVSGDHYTYVRNPRYWNKSAVHYRQIVIKVISSPSAVLQAIRTGQIDVAPGDNSTASSAKASGISVVGVPQNFVGLDLADRAGKLLKPLGDVRVRQAINYALDRKALTKATIAFRGTPTDEVSVSGLDGWVAKDNTYYAYNIKKAKSLLKAAGYAQGFTLPVLTSSLVGLDVQTQAIAGQLAKVGIQVQLNDDSNIQQYITDLVTGKYPAMEITFGALPMFIEGPSLYLPGGPFNPFKSDDATISSWWAQAATAKSSLRKSLYHKIEHRLITQAWFATFGISPLLFYASSHVSGVVGRGGYIPNLVEITPKG